jgi:hypothetical protein
LSTGLSSVASCLCGGYDDQLPSGVETSQQMSLSAPSKAPGTRKFVTWRVADPAPRISTGTSCATTTAGSKRLVARADASATSQPSSLMSRTGASIGA